MTEDLPLEMWEEVLYRNKDALLLWAGLRQTCRAFHDIIEHVFVKKMEIIIYGGMCILPSLLFILLSSIVHVIPSVRIIIPFALHHNTLHSR